MAAVVQAIAVLVVAYFVTPRRTAVRSSHVVSLQGIASSRFRGGSRLQRHAHGRR